MQSHGQADTRTEERTHITKEERIRAHVTKMDKFLAIELQQLIGSALSLPQQIAPRGLGTALPGRRFRAYPIAGTGPRAGTGPSAGTGLSAGTGARAGTGP